MFLSGVYVIAKENHMEREEKLKALDAALAQIERQFGKGSVMKLGDPGTQMNVETIPTGSLSLDIALGLGGIPKGRIVEIYGPESSGKTTVTLHMIAEVQKRGGIAGFIDAEHALDPVYAKNIGVDIDNLYISQPDNGEQALEITETMVRSGAVDIVVVDSVAALVPKAEIDGEMGDSHVGLQARLMSRHSESLRQSSASPTVLLYLSTSFVRRWVLCSVIPRQLQAEEHSSSIRQSDLMSDVLSHSSRPVRL